MVYHYGFIRNKKHIGAERNNAHIDMLNSFIFDIYNEKQLDKLGRQLRCALNTLKELQPVLDKYFA